MSRRIRIRTYLGGHHCSEALGVEQGFDTIPLTNKYIWECVRDCPWKGGNARLLSKYETYLSQFRVCVHASTVAKSWAASEQRFRPAAKPPPTDVQVAPDECEARPGSTGRRSCSKKRKKDVMVNGKRTSKLVHALNLRPFPGICGDKWICNSCEKYLKRVPGAALAMFPPVVRFCGPALVSSP